MNREIADQSTLRDQFAMAALAAYLSLEDAKEYGLYYLAKQAYAAADAMLKVRKEVGNA